MFNSPFVGLPENWLENGLIKVELFNNSGQKIRAFNLEENQTKLDVYGLRNGMYHLVFFPKNGRVVSDRFVKME